MKPLKRCTGQIGQTVMMNEHTRDEVVIGIKGRDAVVLEDSTCSWILHDRELPMSKKENAYD